LELTNALAYCGMVFITTVKKFYNGGPRSETPIRDKYERENFSILENKLWNFFSEDIFVTSLLFVDSYQAGIALVRLG
jgi:hypothetical protein